MTPEQPLMPEPFEVKLTLPLGEALPLTTAVNVTDWPTVEGFMLDDSVVVVAAAFTTCDRFPLLPV